MGMSVLTDLHVSASETMRRVLLEVRTEHLDVATPCTGWTMADLLAHQLGQELGMAGALGGRSRELADWVPVDSGEQAPEILTQALLRTDAALEEFSDPDAGEVWMPEIRPQAPLGVQSALRAHLLDLAVHSWDIGVSIGHPPVIDPDVADLVLEVARGIPATAREKSGHFTEVLDVPAGAAAFTESLLLCGRDPGWTPPPAA